MWLVFLKTGMWRVSRELDGLSAAMQLLEQWKCENFYVKLFTFHEITLREKMHGRYPDSERTYPYALIRQILRTCENDNLPVHCAVTLRYMFCTTYDSRGSRRRMRRTPDLEVWALGSEHVTFSQEWKREKWKVSCELDDFTNHVTSRAMEMCKFSRETFYEFAPREQIHDR